MAVEDQSDLSRLPLVKKAERLAERAQMRGDILILAEDGEGDAAGAEMAERRKNSRRSGLDGKLHALGGLRTDLGKGGRKPLPRKTAFSVR